MALLKKMASCLPEEWQMILRRRLYARQIRKGQFYTTEPEYARLAEWIREGDWVLDVGANIGHYSKRFSELVGASGRVLAFEPVATTFHLLSSNARHFAHANVTLFQTAVSDGTRLLGMNIPSFETGLKNYYEAELTEETGDVAVMTLSVDSLNLPGHVSLVKIDAEGHERQVLDGMKNLLAVQHPVLIVETGDKEVIADLRSMGYVAEQLSSSPNWLFRWS